MTSCPTSSHWSSQMAQCWKLWRLVATTALLWCKPVMLMKWKLRKTSRALSGSKRTRKCHAKVKCLNLNRNISVTAWWRALTSVNIQTEISSFPFSLCHCLATHLSASDSFMTVALYISSYVLRPFHMWAVMMLKL